jgi:ABC-type dipeptide/oligopeptide/nickel transport system permease subunit
MARSPVTPVSRPALRHRPAGWAQRWGLDLRLGLGGAILVVFALMAAFPAWFTSASPTDADLGAVLQPPFGEFLLGTDGLGRDLATRMVYGARYSLVVAAGALALAAVVGTLVGLVAGWAGRVVDEIVMRVLDIWMAFPGVLLAVALIAGLGPGLANIVAAMGIYLVPTFARLVRVEVIATKSQLYVLASKALGTPAWVVLVRTVAPIVLVKVVLVQVAVRFGVVLLSAAGLGFLGLGVQPPTPEWGQMISEGGRYLTRTPYPILFPGIALVIVVLAFNVVGEWLQDRANRGT